MSHGVRSTERLVTARIRGILEVTQQLPWKRAERNSCEQTVDLLPTSPLILKSPISDINDKPRKES
jgi:hypothetical protein